MGKSFSKKAKKIKELIYAQLCLNTTLVRPVTTYFLYTGN